MNKAKVNYYFEDLTNDRSQFNNEYVKPHELHVEVSDLCFIAIKKFHIELSIIDTVFENNHRTMELLAEPKGGDLEFAMGEYLPVIGSNVFEKRSNFESLDLRLHIEGLIDEFVIELKADTPEDLTTEIQSRVSDSVTEEKSSKIDDSIKDILGDNCYSFPTDPRSASEERQEEIDDFCELLKQTWKNNPCLRFGQLVENIKNNGDDLFVIKDEEMLEKVKTFLRNNENKP